MATRVAIKDICKVYDGPHATPQKTEDGPVYLGIDAITDDGQIDQISFLICQKKITLSGQKGLPLNMETLCSLMKPLLVDTL